MWVVVIPKMRGYVVEEEAVELEDGALTKRVGRHSDSCVRTLTLWV
jgi:hypothetical protein